MEKWKSLDRTDEMLLDLLAEPASGRRLSSHLALTPQAVNARLRRLEEAGLVHAGSMEFSESYSRTLREWYRAFNDRWDDIAGLGFDDRFRRMWNMYLTSCAACFAAGTTDVTQISLRRPS